VPEGVALLSEPRHVPMLVKIIVHVDGEHLGAWDRGLERLRELKKNPLAGREVDDGILTLRVAKGEDLADLSPSVLATAAAAVLGQKQVARAGQLFREAAALGGALQPGDPGNRALAVAGNNLASELCEQENLSADATALMLLAADTGRKYWERAGTWLNVARAEWRVAVCRLKAGDAGGAATHARLCLDELAKHPEAEAFDQFYGWEAYARAERALGRDFRASREQARAAFERLSEDDKPYCRPALAALN
jgi:hypothetical protein